MSYLNELEISSLQDALAYWLPNMPEQKRPVSDRIAKDAYLLCGVDGNNDEPSAYTQGLIALNPNQEIDRLKAINADLLAALQKLLNFPSKKHFNGESYAEEHGEVIGECLAAIAIATRGAK